MAPILCYVTDRKLLPVPQTEALLAAVRRAATAGVDWIQIREKDLSARAQALLARETVASVRGTATRILINERLDVALAVGAGGIHLGAESLPVAEVAGWCAKNAPIFVVGASCHSLAEAQLAEQHGANYIVFGPVFSTPSKLAYGPPQGLGCLEEVCRNLKIPVLAIGGVTLENACECLGVGAAGIAGIRLFQDASDLPALILSLRTL